MRIVSGKFGSRPLKTLTGSTTRPTSDKIRGAIFSKIGPYFDGGKFLDVFGGSGAMALEALSRGMDHATIIEMDRKAMSIIKENVTNLGVMNQVSFKAGDSRRVVETLKNSYDIVFMDPPYAYPHIEQVALNIINQELVHEDSWLIIETDSKRVMPEIIAHFERIDCKDYKATCVHYYIAKSNS